ncbi:MAG: phospholipase D-like domain-containing protein [bacterium]|nr:phospholipase D-like domain-containing protein [bacterium]
MCKNTKQIFIILFLLISIITSNSIRAQNVEPLREAEITNISGRKYYPAVKEILDKSQKSISMAMYLVSIDEKNTQSEVYQLCESLVNAKKRGVKVKVILDQTIDYKRLDSGDEWQNEGGNQNAFRFFKKNEIDVLYDTKAIHTHSKVIVVDENIVILGSTNWSDSALNKNNEASVVIRSKELARSLIKDFSEIVIDHEMSGDIKEKEPSFAIYRYFLENENLAGKMLNIHDERAFDLYLLLLREFKGDGFIDFDFEKMAEYLGIDKDTGKTPYRSLITETLKKLKDTYNLIKYETQYGENAKVTLLDPENNDKPYKYPEEKYFTLPGEYFSYGWDRRLSFTGKFCYLINLYEASLNKDIPWWSYPRETLSNHFNSNTKTISSGMTELKKFEIIDIEYSDIEDGYESRGPSKYRLFDLYDPIEQAKKFENLKNLYGAEKVDQAREFAKVVFEENDLVVVEDIISLINEYGIDKYQKAINIISNKAEDNPKRSQKYLVGILKGL